MTEGIYLLGGGGLLRGLDKLIEEETKVKTKVGDDPLTAVARGAGFALEHLNDLSDVLLEVEDIEPPK